MENNEPLLVPIFDGDGGWTYPVTPNPSVLDGHYDGFSSIPYYLPSINVDDPLLPGPHVPAPSRVCHHA
jgi:hypothetical protein